MSNLGKDHLYQYDTTHINLLNEEKPWKNDVKYFKTVTISALASMKMLNHSISGVELGKSESWASFEVMGLMVGKPEGDTIVIMDAYPLPVKGAENSVVADSPEVQEYMVTLMESLEASRLERFVGWYHSHPFDVDGTSHCYLSSTDVSTQFSWQNQLDPWVAVVIDPLRSLARKEPDIQAFRCYPVKHNPPTNECPDGTEADEETKQLRWGKSSNRYYQLKVEHFMSSVGSNLLSILSKNHLWIRMLSNNQMIEPESRDRLSTRMEAISKNLGENRFGGNASTGFSKASKAANELSNEHLLEQEILKVKNELFNLSNNTTNNN